MKLLAAVTLALDLMTSISELDLDMVVNYRHAKNRSIGQAVQKISSAKKGN